MRLMERVLLSMPWLFGALALSGCVTINVYFPEAAAQQASEQFVDAVLGADAEAVALPTEPAPTAAGVADLRVQTPATVAIRHAMQARFQEVLKSQLRSGTLGFDQAGLVAIRDLSGLPKQLAASVETAVQAENTDRDRLYRAIALANGHPEWEGQIRASFAQGWIERARQGWYYRDSSGRWLRR